jgi:hypothetical protein
MCALFVARDLDERRVIKMQRLNTKLENKFRRLMRSFPHRRGEGKVRALQEMKDTRDEILRTAQEVTTLVRDFDFTAFEAAVVESLVIEAKRDAERRRQKEIQDKLLNNLKGE